MFASGRYEFVDKDGIGYRLDGPNLQRITNTPPNLAKVSSAQCFSLFLDKSDRVWASGCNCCYQTGLGLMARYPWLCPVIRPLYNKLVYFSQKISIVNSLMLWSTVWHNPKLIPNVPLAQDVVAVQNKSLILDLDNQVWVCGQNESGFLRLGYNLTIERFTRLNLPKIAKIIPNKNSVLYLSCEGQVWACGQDNTGQLGLRDPSDLRYCQAGNQIQDHVLNFLEPTLVKLDHMIVDIFLDERTSLLLTTEGQVLISGRVPWESQYVTRHQVVTELSPYNIRACGILTPNSFFLDDVGRVWILRGYLRTERSLVKTTDDEPDENDISHVITDGRQTRFILQSKNPCECVLKQLELPPITEMVVTPYQVLFQNQDVQVMTGNYHDTNIVTETIEQDLVLSRQVKLTNKITRIKSVQS